MRGEVDGDVSKNGKGVIILVETNIFDPLFNTKDYIYHYTSAETALLYILPQKRLLFSSLANTNDPREKRNRILHCVDDAIIGDSMLIASRMQSISKKIWGDIRILCFSQDDTFKPNDILYLDKGCSKYRMWAQYANNHKGICLAFKKDSIIEQFNSTYMNIPHFYGNVSYASSSDIQSKNYDAFTICSSELTKQDETIASDRINKYHSAYYFTKHKDWQTENEFRLTIQANSSEKMFIDIDGSLEAIIMGGSFDENLFDLVEILINNFENKPIHAKPFFQ